jgi:hypothetical protein
MRRPAIRDGTAATATANAFGFENSFYKKNALATSSLITLVRYGITNAGHASKATIG